MGVGAKRNIRAVVNVMEYDIRNFFKYKWWIVGLISMNLADLFIMAVVYTQMTKRQFAENYFYFFSPGITIIALFAAAFMIGREINWEVRRSISHYMLSLPITRWQLAVGRVLAGGVRGMIYMSPLLLTTFVLLGLPSLPELFIILVSLFLIATGIAGLSIALAVSTTSFEKFVTARSVVYYLLYFASTIFYPLRNPELVNSLINGGLPSQLVTMAQLNPLSSGADLIRSFLMPDYMPFTIDLFRNIVVFSAVFTLGATFAYMKILEHQ